MGGGYPISVFGGRAEIMERLMPQGDCQHSGTYNGHIVSVAAAGAALRAFREPDFYPHIHTLADRLCGGLMGLFQRHGIVGRVQWLGARLGIYMGIDREVCNYADARQHDRELMLKFIAAAIEAGVYFHDYGGAAVHHGFCAAMTVADVDEALQRLDTALGRIAG